jgi:RNA polymerase sigma-70 factor (ECF subfamily)
MNRLITGTRAMVNSQALMQKTDYSENDLILQAKAGSHAAFEALYREHLGRVHAICVRILSDRSWAEDVTQKIFIHAWTKLNSFRRFSSWLYRLSVNMIFDELRLTGSRDDQNIGKNQPVLFVASCSEPVRNLRLDLNRAIDSLPRQARIIFVLHDMAGFTHEEIGDAMKLAAGTCKAQLSRARRLLREALKQ